MTAKTQGSEGATVNPYLNARREWNGHVSAVLSAARTWQVIGILSLMIALVAVAGVVHIGSQSKFVPYVVEVDQHGQVRAVNPADAATPTDPRVIHAALASFINDARMVTPDVSVQRNAVFRVYALLAPSDPATAKMNEWYNGSEDASPFKRAAKETVSIEITSVLPQSDETWQIDWIETVRDRQGSPKAPPFRMRALITIYLVPPSSATTEEQIRRNPLGIFVKDFSWSRQA
jgi:type IV secretory pathway TrbF-like protein